MTKKKTVQGTYISIPAKEALDQEAAKRNTNATRLASEILERAAKRFPIKEAKDGV
jgi:hypothetical protein